MVFCNVDETTTAGSKGVKFGGNGKEGKGEQRNREGEEGICVGHRREMRWGEAFKSATAVSVTAATNIAMWHNLSGCLTDKISVKSL